MFRTERRAGTTAHTRGTVVRQAALVLAVLAAVLAVPGAASAAPRAAATAPRAPAAPTAPSSDCPDVAGIPRVGQFCAEGKKSEPNSLSSLNPCAPAPPPPEQANNGVDSLLQPPTDPTARRTLYQTYGMAGQSWAPYDLGCSDVSSIMGNTVAGAVFDAAKTVDRVVISIYQAAVGPGLLDWLSQHVDQLISRIGNAVYFPYLAAVVLLGAMWLAWQGLIRRRASRTFEGTIWMVAACVAAIWLIGRPGDFTGIGKDVSNAVTNVTNVAFSNLTPSDSKACVPVQSGDPQSVGENGAGNSVDQNADELWSVLVCQPWLAGEFGSSAPSGPIASYYGRQLLYAQAIAGNEKLGANADGTQALLQRKNDVYLGIANDLSQNHPELYPLFQGKEWPTRLEIAFSALFAALIAGALVLLVSVVLIVLKIGFLLLLVAGPLFLIIGTYPGAGRVVAVRWFELLVGVLLKQIAVAIAMSVLLYCYALVMATDDSVLPWGLKVLMIALLTIAVFIYRRPFQHLFSSVGYQAIGSRERAETDLAKARTTFRARTLDAASATIPGFDAYRTNRWARQNPDQAAQAKYLAGEIAAPGAGTVAAAAQRHKGGRAAPDLARNSSGGPGSGGTGRGGGSKPGGGHGGGRGSGSHPGAEDRGVRGGPTGNGRAEPPPLNLPRRPGQGGAGSNSGRPGDAGAVQRRRPDAGYRQGDPRSQQAGASPPKPANWLRPIRRDR